MPTKIQAEAIHKWGEATVICCRLLGGSHLQKARGRSNQQGLSVQQQLHVIWGAELGNGALKG